MVRVNNRRVVLLLAAIASLSMFTTSKASPKDTVRLTFRMEGTSERRLSDLIDREAQALVPADSIPSITANSMRALAKKGYPLAEVVGIEEESGVPASMVITFEPGWPLEVQWIDEGGSGNVEGIQRVSEAMLREAAVSALDSLTDSGYPLAEVTFEPRFITLTDRLTAEMAKTSHSGPFLRVNALKFPGAVNTRTKTLAQITRIRRGDVFSRTAALRAVDYLRREDYIASVEPANLTMVGPGLAELSFRLSERGANRISALAAYDPTLDRPVGQVHLRFGNLMGTGRSLGISWESLTSYRRRSAIAYREPWLLGKPAAVEAGFSQLRGDSTGTNTAFKLGADWRPQLSLTLRVQTGWETFAAPDPQDNRYTVTLEGGLEWDDWDHPWNPRRGWRAETSRKLGFRSDRHGARSELTRDRASFFVVSPLSGKLLSILHGALDDTRGSDLLIDDVIRLGGTETMRGYSEERYPTEGAAWGGWEGRWRPDEGGYVGLFVDQGWRYRRFEAETGRIWLTSYGFTGRVETRAGLIGMDLGWAIGEPFQRGRLHLRFENRF